MSKRKQSADVDIDQDVSDEEVCTLGVVQGSRH